MDDFYNEMKSTLEDVKTSKSTSQTQDSTSFLQRYYPNMFADALVPVNPVHWPSFVAGSASSSQMPEFGEKIKTPFENLIVAKEYLETSQSDIQWRDRCWQVAEDTMTINLSCELGKDAGAFTSGIIANKIADRYMDEMIETSATLNSQEKLNDKIFKQVAKDQGLNPISVRGTGVIREFVPDFMKNDLCNRPERYSRPFDDDYGQGPLEDGIILNSKNNDFGPSGDSVFESSSSPVEDQKNWFSHFFDLFGTGSEEGMCPAAVETVSGGYTDSPLMDKFCGLFDFLIPESGGAYYCSDPSKMVLPSLFIGDMGDFCQNSD